MAQESGYDYYNPLVFPNQNFWYNNSASFLEATTSSTLNWTSQDWPENNFESFQEPQLLNDSSDCRYKPYPSQEYDLENLSQSTKNAAKLRRERENVEFRQLALYLPLPKTISSQLDKASIVKLVNSFFQLKVFMTSDDSCSEGMPLRQRAKFRCLSGHFFSLFSKKFWFSKATMYGSIQKFYILKTIELYVWLESNQISHHNWWNML